MAWGTAQTQLFLYFERNEYWVYYGNGIIRRTKIAWQLYLFIHPYLVRATKSDKSKRRSHAPQSTILNESVSILTFVNKL